MSRRGIDEPSNGFESEGAFWPAQLRPPSEYQGAIKLHLFSNWWQSSSLNPISNLIRIEAYCVAKTKVRNCSAAYHFVDDSLAKSEKAR